MEESFLFSDVWPLFTEIGEETIDDCFMREIQKADQIEIAVGFSSCGSLRILDRLVMQLGIKNITLILGMYYFNGFPETLLELAIRINRKWQREGIGEIRIVHSFKYHGKLYCFTKNNQIFSVIIGSPNLSFLVANKKAQEELQQYEIALFTNDPKTLKNSWKHINSLKSKNISRNISTLYQKYSSDDTAKDQGDEEETIFKINYQYE